MPGKEVPRRKVRQTHAAEDPCPWAGLWAFSPPLLQCLPPTPVHASALTAVLHLSPHWWPQVGVGDRCAFQLAASVAWRPLFPATRLDFAFCECSYKCLPEPVGPLEGREIGGEAGASQILLCAQGQLHAELSVTGGRQRRHLCDPERPAPGSGNKEPLRREHL